MLETDVPPAQGLEKGMDQARWLDCGYGRDSAIMLSRRLDGRIRECVVTYRKRSREGRPGITFRCR